MQATLNFKDNSDYKAAASVSHREYASELTKTLKISVGNEVIEIVTDEEGLKKIADAINNHPQDMKSQVEAKLKAAIDEARKHGIGLPAGHAVAPGGEIQKPLVR